jgi:hypothetical protein
MRFANDRLGFFSHISISNNLGQPARDALFYLYTNSTKVSSAFDAMVDANKVLAVLSGNYAAIVERTSQERIHGPAQYTLYVPDPLIGTGSGNGGGAGILDWKANNKLYVKDDGSITQMGLAGTVYLFPPDP